MVKTILYKRTYRSLILSAVLHYRSHSFVLYFSSFFFRGWLGSRVVSVLDSGAEGPGFKSQPPRCRVTVGPVDCEIIIDIFRVA